MSSNNSNFLINTKWLSEHLEDENLVIVDCQWDVNAYLRAHIPGAIMRSGHPYVKSEKNGKPTLYLPTAEEFAALTQQLGIDDDSLVVCYDEWDNHFATRLWWVLRYYGFYNACILDGGWQAWVTTGLPVSFISSKPIVKNRTLNIQENTSSNVKITEVLANYNNPDWQILDVRSIEEFEGKNLAGNKRGGHIDGAIHIEWKNMLAPANRSDGINYFRPVEDMQELLKERGVDKDKTIVVHCQSGVRASSMVFCMEMLGYPKVRLYDGSMSEWANRNDTPLNH